MPRTFRIFAILLLLTGISGCGRAPSQAEIDKRAQEMLAEQKHKEELAEKKAAEIEEENARRAESAQKKREELAENRASRNDTREASRALNLEHAAAEQARREEITSELTSFIDSLWIQVMQGKETESLRMNGQPARPGSVLVSPAGYSVTYTKHDGDYFWFTYDEDAFTLVLKKPSGGLSSIEMRAKQPLALGFQIGQPLPEVPSEAGGFSRSTSSRGFLVLKATYGAGQTQRDVKDLVKSKIQNGRLDFRANSGELGGDPIFGQVKTFYIKYVSNSRTLEKSFREGEHVSLP